MSRSFALLLVMLTAACSQLPLGTQTAKGNGRYLQMSSGGRTFLQIDTPSPESCKYHSTAKPNPNVEMLCSTDTQSAALPKYFTMTNVFTEEQLPVRSKNLEGCEFVKKEIEKSKGEPNSVYAGYKVSPCF